MLRLGIPLLLLAFVVGVSVVSDRPAPRADFVYADATDVATLDVARMSWMQDLRVARLLFEGLLRNDTLGDYSPAPAIAESWDISEDARTYTFHLREGARWSNGDAVTAHDFVFSWRRALLPDTTSDYANFFWLIRGGRAFYDWRTEALAEYARGEARSVEASLALLEETYRVFEETVGVRALDDLTLEVQLEDPVPYFLDLCAFPVLYPVHAETVRSFERPDPATGRIISQRGWTKPERLVCNGAFRLAVWRFKRDMRLAANEHWWNRDSLAIDSIEITSINDANAQVLAFETGVVDWLTGVTPAYRDALLDGKRAFYAEHAEEVTRLQAMGLDRFEVDRRLPSDPRNRVHPIPAFGTYFYNFNCLPYLTDGRPNPFADARVRRAFAMTVDKRMVCEEVVGLGNPVARTLIPPGSVAGYSSPEGLVCVSDARTPGEREELVGRARALMAEAGYSDISTFPTVELLFNKDAGHDLVAQAVARDWERMLGVQVSLQQKELKVFRDDMKNHRFMISRAGWYGDYGDPTTFLDPHRTGDGNNDRGYSSEAYDELLRRASKELDPAARMEILREAERMIVEQDLPLIPIYNYVTLYMFDAKRVSGLNAHPRTIQQLYLIDMLGDGKGRDQPVELGFKGVFP